MYPTSPSHKCPQSLPKSSNFLILNLQRLDFSSVSSGGFFVCTPCLWKFLQIHVFTALWAAQLNRMVACEVAPVFVGRCVSPRPWDPSRGIGSSTCHSPTGSRRSLSILYHSGFFFPSSALDFLPLYLQLCFASHTDPYALVWGRVLSVSLCASCFTSPLRKWMTFPHFPASNGWSFSRPIKLML